MISRRCLLSSSFLVSRAGAEVTPDIVRFRPEIEPLVSLIERTPRADCPAMAAAELRRGVSYRQFMAALFLAGVRNVNPRPPGFAMHCVFVIHSAHQLSLEAPAASRMLPLFYALDQFKNSQRRDAGQASGDYWMRPIRGTLPPPDRAAAELTAAFEAWDIERADRAAVALARHRGPAEAFHLLWRYGARDYRNIGHKAIYAANAARTLHTIGWQHAEPVIRSVVTALLDFGREQKVNGYAMDDQCWTANLKRARESVSRLHADWLAEPGDSEAARAIVSSIRETSPEEACAQAVARLVKGSANAASVWDGVHLAAAELAMRARAGGTIVAIHSVTAANGLHQAWLATSDAETRLLLLLQGVGWMGQFRVLAESRPDATRPLVVTDIELPARDAQARQAFLTAAIRNTVAKANEVHYYKYLAALIEDIPLVSPHWQPHLVQAVSSYSKAATDPDPAWLKSAAEFV